MSTTPSVNSISGKVVLKESGIGIPDLVVAIYDLDPGTKPEEEIGTPAGPISATSQPFATQPAGDSLGSVQLNKDGTFRLTFDDAEFRIRKPDERRPDLLLMILAPEDADSETPPKVLFSSKLLRQNSGRTES
jgi:hypothetical protein